MRVRPPENDLNAGRRPGRRAGCCVILLRVNPKLVVVEDDQDLSDLLGRGLRAEGFDVVLAATGGQLLTIAEIDDPDVFVIDVGLPDSDGRDVCQALRARGVQSPVLFLTASGTLTDRLSGFHAGGDDYLVKPFAFKELVVRLRALIRRAPDEEPSTDEDGRLQLDPARHSVVVEQAEVPLTPTEYRLLAAMAARPGEVVRRGELVAAGWPDGAIVHDNTLDAYVARLRRKLREVGRDGAIATAHGVGYRLE
jgi:two-component system, OmpR family, response regulator